MSFVARLPFTLLFVAVMCWANFRAGTLDGVLPAEALSTWGISHGSVRAGEVHRLISGTFLSHDLAMFLRQVVFASCVIGLYEWTAGTLRAGFMFFTIDLLGTLIVLFAGLPLLISMAPSVDATALGQFDVGMSAGGFGLLGALIAMTSWRWAGLLAVLLAILIKVWVDLDPIADVAHLVCLGLGFGLQRLVFPRMVLWQDATDVAQIDPRQQPDERLTFRKNTPDSGKRQKGGKR